MNTDEFDQIAAGERTLEIKSGLRVFAKRPAAKFFYSEYDLGSIQQMDGTEFIKLNKSDSNDGQHHWIPRSWVESVSGQIARIKKTRAEFCNERLNEPPPF